MTKQEIMAKTKALWSEAEQRDEKNGFRGKYEFEMGKNIFKVLSEEADIYSEPTLEDMLYSIPVRKNLQNSNTLKLWQEVEIEDRHEIRYASPNGYTGVLYGGTHYAVYKDGKMVFHTVAREINTLEELKKNIETFPEFLGMLEREL